MWKRRGFMLIALLAVITIIAILITNLFSVFSHVRENARAESHHSNPKQVGGGA